MFSYLKKHREKNHFDFFPWKKHRKSFVSIFGFEKNVKKFLFRLLALKKTSKIVRFHYHLAVYIMMRDWLSQCEARSAKTLFCGPDSQQYAIHLQRNELLCLSFQNLGQASLIRYYSCEFLCQSFIDLDSNVINIK